MTVLIAMITILLAVPAMAQEDEPETSILDAAIAIVRECGPECVSQLLEDTDTDTVLGLPIRPCRAAILAAHAWDAAATAYVAGRGVEFETSNPLEQQWAHHPGKLLLMKIGVLVATITASEMLHKAGSQGA